MVNTKNIYKKKVLLFYALVFSTVAVWTQLDSYTFSGDYIFTNLEETDTKAGDFRFSGNYEFSSNQGLLSHSLIVAFYYTTVAGIQKAKYIQFL